MKGQNAKEYIKEKIIETLKENYIGEFDRKLYFPLYFFFHLSYNLCGLIFCCKSNENFNKGKRV